MITSYRYIHQHPQDNAQLSNTGMTAGWRCSEQHYDETTVIGTIAASRRWWLVCQKLNRVSIPVERPEVVLEEAIRVVPLLQFRKTVPVLAETRHRAAGVFMPTQKL